MDGERMTELSSDPQNSEKGIYSDEFLRWCSHCRFQWKRMEVNAAQALAKQRHGRGGRLPRRVGWIRHTQEKCQSAAHVPSNPSLIVSLQLGLGCI